MLEQRIGIIGRGLAGLTLAFRMVQAGFRPVVFGASRGPANASRCAQGIVCNKGLIFAESPLFRAKLQTIRQLETWLHSIEVVSQQEIPRSWQGVDEPYWSEEDFQKTLQRVYRGNFWGCYRPVNHPPRDWLLKNFKKPLGFMRYPDDAWFDVDATMNALEAACRKNGVDFFEETVEALDHTADGIELKTQKNKHIFDHLVIASGAESIHLLQKLGLECPRFFQVGGQSLTWTVDDPDTQRILVKGNLSLAVLPGRRILGSSSWKSAAGVLPNLEEDRQVLLRLGEAAFGFSLADIPPQSIQSHWGVRLRFVDRMPALGIWPDANLQQRVSVLTGFYKNGLQLADLCAEQLLNELTGQDLSEFGRAFHVDRFFSSKRRAPGSPPHHCPLKKQNPH